MTSSHIYNCVRCFKITLCFLFFNNISEDLFIFVVFGFCQHCAGMSGLEAKLREAGLVKQRLG